MREILVSHLGRWTTSRFFSHWPCAFKTHFPGQHTRPGRIYIYIHNIIYNPYGSKHLLRRYQPPQIIPQTLPKKELGLMGQLYKYIYIYIYICVYIYKHNQSYIYTDCYISYIQYINGLFIIHKLHINDIHIMEYSFIIYSSYIICGIEYIYLKSRIHIIIYSPYDER